MNENKAAAVMMQLERTKKALEKNNINAFIVETRSEALDLVRSMMKEGSTVANGGSVSIAECGIMELLRSGKYNYLDREKCSDKNKLYHESFNADYYLCSSNAVTENGELYNVDGNSNRVACICYGPESVIMVVGRNKIVRNIAEAQKRVKLCAAPPNTIRLSCMTYCHDAGICMGYDGSMTDGCRSDGRICSNYVVSAYQRNKGRINVILVNDDLGY